MFTGLIEEVGSVLNVAPLASSDREGTLVTVSAQGILNKLTLGASVAVDGVCTTVVELLPNGFNIELSPETLSKTTFGQYQPGSRVNLECPLTPSSPIGGHYVTGHVDGTAEIVTRVKNGISWVYRFRVENPELLPLLVEKGSVAVSGISLTVNTVIKDVFSVAIIPHTLTHTNLDDYGEGDRVNIETDLLGKYVQRMLQFGRVETHQTEAKPVATGRIHTGDWFCHDEALHAATLKGAD